MKIKSEMRFFRFILPRCLCQYLCIEFLCVALSPMQIDANEVSKSYQVICRHWNANAVKAGIQLGDSEFMIYAVVFANGVLLRSMWDSIYWFFETIFGKIENIITKFMEDSSILHDFIPHNNFVHILFGSGWVVAKLKHNLCYDIKITEGKRPFLVLL